MIVVVDTSGIVAALDDQHSDGEAARAVLAGAGTLVVPPVILAEVDHVARRRLGPRAAHDALAAIARWARVGRAVLPEVTSATLDAAAAVRRRYADLELDLADAVTVVVAADFRSNAILTLDRRDFRAIRPLSRHDAFLLLPDDA